MYIYVYDCIYIYIYHNPNMSNSCCFSSLPSQNRWTSSNLQPFSVFDRTKTHGLRVCTSRLGASASRALDGSTLTEWRAPCHICGLHEVPTTDGGGAGGSPVTGPWYLVS